MCKKYIRCNRKRGIIRGKIRGIFENRNPTEEQKRKYIKSRQEINKKLVKSRFNYVRSDIMEKIIKNCRGVKKCNDNMDRKDKEKQRENFRSPLDFKENDIFQRKEYSRTLKRKKMFLNEIINEQYKVDKYFIDIVFPVHKLGVEIDENGHLDRCKIKEQKRQEIMKKETGFKIMRMNPDKENFDIFDEIGKIQSFISRSNKRLTEKSTKKSLINDTEKLTRMVKQLCL